MLTRAFLLDSAPVNFLARVSPVASVLRRSARDLIDLCYPGTCAACAALTPDGRDVLCAACLNELATLEAAPACPMCASPIARRGETCPRCDGRGIRPFAGVVRLGSFVDPLRHLVHGLKFAGRWPLAETLADRLLGLDRVAALLANTDALVPVPLHPLRQVARGYNQAEVLARRLGKSRGIPLLRPADRVRRTAPQSGQLSRAARARNVKNAFKLKDARGLTGQHLVLIDDVMTTGATLRALGRVLRVARPASLSVLVIATADPKGRDFKVI